MAFVRSALAALRRLVGPRRWLDDEPDEVEDDRVVDLDAALADYDLRRPRRPRPEELERMTHRELRAEAKRLGVRGYSRMSSAQLRRAIGGE